MPEPGGVQGRRGTSLVVWVRKANVIVANAVVELEGMGLRRQVQCNAVGRATFHGIPPGTYYVNAAKGPDYIGVGWIEVREDEKNEIFINPPEQDKRGRLRVSVESPSGVPMHDVRVSISGPEVKSSGPPIPGSALFRDLAPGRYSVVAEGTASAQYVRGSATADVQPGREAQVRIRLRNPDDTQKKTEQQRIRELESRKSELRSEILSLKSRITQKRSNIAIVTKQNRGRSYPSPSKDIGPSKPRDVAGRSQDLKERAYNQLGTAAWIYMMEQKLEKLEEEKFVKDYEMKKVNEELEKARKHAGSLQ